LNHKYAIIVIIKIYFDFNQIYYILIYHFLNLFEVIISYLIINIINQKNQLIIIIFKITFINLLNFFNLF